MAASHPPLTRTDLAGFLSAGLSMLVATRDERMAVELVRCGGARLGDDGRVRLAIPLPEGKRTLFNVESTGVISLVGAFPLNYRTVQLKGRDAACVDWPELNDVALAHRARLIEVLVGQAGAIPLAWSYEFAAVSFTPTEMYDQTPGPLAGLPLAP